MLENLLWVEKYRPHKIEDCVLPDVIKNTFLEYVKKGEIPNLLLSGTPGVGKTTVARALCDEVGCDYIIINGSLENGIDVIRNKIRNYASSMSLSGGRKVVIIDEADYLTRDAQPGLRGAVEEFALNCSFIFTCNYKNRIIEPLHSRFAHIDFRVNGGKAQLAAAFFKRVEYILKEEKITYDKSVIAEIITKYFPDNRRILGELQRYSASGTIDKGILANISDSNMTELNKSLKDKDFSAMRKWVTHNMDNDSTRIFRRIYDGLNDLLKPSSMPQVIVTLAKYQYQAAFAADQEINMVACLTEIMVDGDFK